MSKIIKSGGSFGLWLANLGKKALTNIAIPLARKNLPGCVINLFSSAINQFDKKISAKGSVRAGKRSALFISNEGMNDFIKIIKLLEGYYKPIRMY